MGKLNDFLKLFTKSNIRSTLAIMVTLLCFGVIYRVSWDRSITTDDMGLIAAVTPILTITLSYYFGSNKDATDYGTNYPCPDCDKNRLHKKAPHIKEDDEEIIG